MDIVLNLKPIAVFVISVKNYILVLRKEFDVKMLYDYLMLDFDRIINFHRVL
jgi:hypothetical protein